MLVSKVHSSGDTSQVQYRDHPNHSCSCALRLGFAVLVASTDDVDPEAIVSLLVLAVTKLSEDEVDAELLVEEALLPVLVDPVTDEVDVVVAVDDVEVADVVLEEVEVVVLSSSPQMVVLHRYAPSKKIVPNN